MQKLIDLALGIFPGLVAFVMIPIAIYLPNQADFDFSPSYLYPFALAAISWVMVVAAFVAVLPKLAAKAAIPLFVFGVFLLLSDLLAPVQQGLVTGEQAAEMLEPTSLILIELVLAVVLVVAAVLIPNNLIRTVGALFTSVILVSEVFLFAVQVQAPEVLTADASRASSDSDHPRPNVYHIILDEWTFLPVHGLACESAAVTPAHFAQRAGACPFCQWDHDLGRAEEFAGSV